MKNMDNMEEAIKKKLNFTASAEMRDRILDDVLKAQEKSKKTISVFKEPNIGRIIMKSPIVKLAAAAVIIAVFVFGIFEFRGIENTSGVVWAEVARKTEASRGVTFRGRETNLNSPDGGDDYSIHYLSSTRSRFDVYRGDQITKTFYTDYNTKMLVFIDHVHKSYIKSTLEGMEENDLWRNPKSLVQRFLSHKYRKLGQKTIEGVLCEGIETTDPASAGADSQVDSLMARVWVSVETRYPVLLEVELVANHGEIRGEAVVDQFQWDVELDESLFEPNIPPDYIQIPMQ